MSKPRLPEAPANLHADNIQASPRGSPSACLEDEMAAPQAETANDRDSVPIERTTNDGDVLQSEHGDNSIEKRASEQHLKPDRGSDGGEDNALDERASDSNHRPFDVLESSIGLPPEVAVEIRTLREQLSSINRKLNSRLSIQELESEWDVAREQLGPTGEHEEWFQILRQVDTTSSETNENKSWFYTFEQDFVRSMAEDRLYKEQVRRSRKSWERKHQLQRRFRFMGMDDDEDSDSDGSLDFDLSMENLHTRHLQKMRRLMEDRERYLERKARLSRQRKGEIQHDQSTFRRNRLLRTTLMLDEEKIEVPSLQLDGADGPVTETAPQPKDAAPELNRVDWVTFKALARAEEAGSFAIDILIGEPVITFDSVSSQQYRSRKPPHGKKRDQQQQEKKATGKQPAPSAAPPPLPERIRIHSRQLLRILEKLHKMDVDSTEPLVILRPFKILSYYDDHLREKHKKLLNKFRAHHLGSEQGDQVGTTIGSSSTCTGKEEKEYSDTGLDTDQQKSDMSRRGEETSQSIADEDSDTPEDDPEDDSTSSTAMEHLGCLLKFVDSDISQRLAYLSGPECQRIFFSDIWHLFKPGDEVIGSNGKQAYRVISVTSARHKVVPPWNFWRKRQESSTSDEMPITIGCVYVDFDGKKLGPVSKAFQIKRFDGERAVTSLEIYPLRFHATQRGETGRDSKRDTTLRQELISRGKRFLEVAAIKHMYYAGPTLETKDDVESQVVIDFETAFTAEENRSKSWKPVLTEMFTVEPKEPEEGESCEAECCEFENVHNDGYVEKKRNEEYMSSLVPESLEMLPSVAVYPRPLHASGTPDSSLTDEDLVIMSYRVFGFVLRSRKWAQLDLTHVSDIKTSGKADGPTAQATTAFDSLVLPPGHRNMVQSLILQHFRDKQSLRDQSHRTDIVRGKGKGLILLLHGAPGVGKTTTAGKLHGFSSQLSRLHLIEADILASLEGVAEKFEKPLFQITCGDLGSTAAEVEKALETNFTLASRWDCILLLDEADVFLSTRSPTDFTRNGLVAVFLRVLEYYAGVLFLTTNRIGDFDEAFASRIHISLYYPPLDLPSTKKVFELNLRMLQDRMQSKGRTLDMDDRKLLSYAEEYWNEELDGRWNGRQIRNACQTALALAEYDAEADDDKEVTLRVKHLRTVAHSYLEFMKYLKELFGVGADQRAKEAFLRAGTAQKLQKNALDKLDLSSSNSQAPRTHQSGVYPSRGYADYSLPHAPQSGYTYDAAQHSQYHNSGYPHPEHRQGDQFPHALQNRAAPGPPIAAGREVYGQDAPQYQPSSRVHYATGPPGHYTDTQGDMGVEPVYRDMPPAGASGHPIMPPGQGNLREEVQRRQ